MRGKLDVTFPWPRLVNNLRRVRHAPSGRSRTVWAVIVLGWLLAGCAGPPKASVPFSRPFAFPQDTFAYPNELVWAYRFDPATGEMEHQRREPPATYAHHCFVVARAARQFFQHARFEPDRPVADEATYRRLVRAVVSLSPRREQTGAEKIVIPGYANLRIFSQAHERLLKEECGGAWQSYFQRGHWRMIFPLSRRHQERMAGQLVAAWRRNLPPVVHVVRFPSLTINHALVLMGVVETETAIEFATYDPNSPERATQLIYDRQTRTFHFPRNHYFTGGRVDVYEVYHRLNY